MRPGAGFDKNKDGRLDFQMMPSQDRYLALSASVPSSEEKEHPCPC